MKFEREKNMPKKVLRSDASKYLFVSKTYFGLFMNKNFGKNSMKKDLIHGFIVWVCGDRK